MKIVLHSIGHLEHIVDILTKASYEFQNSFEFQTSAVAILFKLKGGSRGCSSQARVLQPVGDEYKVQYIHEPIAVDIGILVVSAETSGYKHKIEDIDLTVVIGVRGISTLA